MLSTFCILLLVGGGTYKLQVKQVVGVLYWALRSLKAVRHGGCLFWPHRRAWPKYEKSGGGTVSELRTPYAVRSANVIFVCVFACWPAYLLAFFSFALGLWNCLCWPTHYFPWRFSHSRSPSVVPTHFNVGCLMLFPHIKMWTP